MSPSGEKMSPSGGHLDSFAHTIWLPNPPVAMGSSLALSFHMHHTRVCTCIRAKVPTMLHMPRRAPPTLLLRSFGPQPVVKAFAARI